MKKVHSPVSLAIILISLFLVYDPPLARGDALQPTLAVGDHWTYSATGTASGLVLSLTLTLRIVDTETIAISGNTYDAYRIGASSTGTATGPTLTAAVTQSGYSLLRRSDLADIQDLVSTSFTANGLTFTQIQTSTNNPPTINMQFPLSLSKSWTTTTATQTNKTTIPPTGLPTVTIYSNTTTTTYVVTSTPLTTVTSGTYDSYLIRSSSSSGSMESYYSPEVLQPVKVVNYNSTGAVTSTVQLQSYDAWPFAASFSANTGGSSYNLIFETDVSATGITQNPTSITFQVSGTDGVTGRANLTIPRKFNSTDIIVTVDSSRATTTVLSDSSNYYIYFTFPLSTHTITLTYATNTGLPWQLILAIVGATVAILAVAAVLILRRKKPSEETPPPSPETQPTSAPAPPPSPNASPSAG